MVVDALNFLSQGKQVLLHNDLVEGNILKTKEGIKLIDFEYCGVGNALFDVASFLTERKLSMEDRKKIALAYDPDMDLDEL
jgi:thiamine kinase-like enzyme